MYALDAIRNCTLTAESWYKERFSAAVGPQHQGTRLRDVPAAASTARAGVPSRSSNYGPKSDYVSPLNTLFSVLARLDV